MRASKKKAAKKTAKKLKGATATERLNLFERYDELDRDFKERSKQYERARRLRSEHVALIFKKCGAGPWRRNGKRIRIMERRNAKDLTAGPIYFFREENDELEVIE